MIFKYSVQIRRIVDGDTMDVLIDLRFGVDHAYTGFAPDNPAQLIDLGFDTLLVDGRLCRTERVRLARIDTPEIRTTDLREKKFGRLATARVAELLPVGAWIGMTSLLYDAKGKFGRTLVDFDLPDDRKLCQTLLDEHLAVPYNGQNKAEIRALHEANWAILEAKGM